MKTRQGYTLAAQPITFLNSCVQRPRLAAGLLSCAHPRKKLGLIDPESINAPLPKAQPTFD